MDKSKQIDTIRKRNIELTKQLDDIKFQLEFNSQLNMNGYKSANNLINELEKIKQDWLIVLEDLNDKRIKYSCLINDLQDMKKIMVDMGFKIPWYKKIINKFKSH